MVQNSSFGLVNGVYLTLRDDSIIVRADGDGVVGRLRFDLFLLLVLTRHYEQQKSISKVQTIQVASDMQDKDYKSDQKTKPKNKENVSI